MRTNPFYDIWLFLTGNTGAHLGVGAWRYLLVVIFWGLIIASIYLAHRNWQADPQQRTQASLGTWLARVAIGGMWFEGCLWKLPIPSGGFQYWLEQEAKYAAFDAHKTLVTSVLLPNFTLVNLVAFLCEIGMACAFILGFGVRAFALLAMVFAASFISASTRILTNGRGAIFSSSSFAGCSISMLRAAILASMRCCGVRQSLPKAKVLRGAFTAGPHRGKARSSGGVIAQ